MTTLQADAYGTPTEQRRHAVLWVGPSLRPALSERHDPSRRCKRCRHLCSGPYCSRHRFSTQANAVCSTFERLAS
jgi:hypothetical protein